MNYYEKYLKYKGKYLYLKNQLGKGKHRHSYNTVVPEFIEKTKEEYKSDVPRTLNSITIYNNDVSGNDYEPLKNTILFNEAAIIDKENFVVKDFLRMLRENDNKIIELNGFFNINKDYHITQDNGTYVKEDNFPVIFKESEIPSIPIKTKTIEDINIKGFFSNDGVGKKHLHSVMNEYKSKGIKYVFLIAGGLERLVDLYKRYGFKLLLSTFNMYVEGESFFSNESIMFGDIDDIIAATL